MLSGLLKLYPDFTLTANSLSMAAYGKTVQLSISRNAANELVVDINGEIWTVDLMGLFSPAESLGLTFEQYIKEQMVDEYNWMTWIVITFDIVYGVAAMATGIAPLLIGLAPVTITLIIASLYSLLWYYILLPFGLAVYANNANNFNSTDEQEEFKKNSFDFLKTIGEIHLMLAILNIKVMFQKGTSGAEVLQDEVSKGLISNIIRSEFGWVAKILALFSVLIALGTSFSGLVSTFLNSHYTFLIIPFVLSIIGLFERHIGIIMFYLNSFAGLVWLLFTRFVDWIINW
ncbi:MAG: hypothetical protein D6732_13755 [Methanobacteriota archaeon]|nr:MAG: hypothetical protein D6732_13755 [Euryarchaeota archaeon]